eukprot:7366727-Heterocapsa_arctica.AAC.1
MSHELWSDSAGPRLRRQQSVEIGGVTVRERRREGGRQERRRREGIKKVEPEGRGREEAGNERRERE